MSPEPDELLWKFQDIDEYEFEKLVADLWALLGWETEVTPEGDDGGIDIVARKSAPVPQKQVIQVKRYSPDNSVGRPEIQQYSSLRYEDDVDAVVVITTGQFTEGAEEVAKKHNVKLIDGHRLCRQIDTPDRRQLVESYISGSVKQADTNLNSQFDANVSAGSQLMNRFDEDLPADEVPETIPGVIKLRKEIVQDISKIKARFERAEDAYNSQEFYTAFERYIDVFDKRVEIYMAIKRYDAGLSQTNQDTKQHLTTPDTLITRLNQQTSELDEHYIEAFRIAERAKGLEVLINDIDTRCADISRTIKHGDSKKSKGEKDEARARYIKARTKLEKMGEEIEIYEELRNMYDQRIIDTHQESSLDKYEEMKSDVRSKLETLDDSKNIHTISENALGGFDPKILTGTGVTLADQELIDYIDNDEDLNFVFVHKNKGFRIISKDGEERTPHHGGGQNRVLLVTDQRILYIAPMEGYDKTLDFTYERVTDVKASTGLTSRTLEFTTEDGGLKYRFADTGDHREDLEPAANYIRSRID